jgi:hypothetical protein
MDKEKAEFNICPEKHISQINFVLRISFLVSSCTNVVLYVIRTYIHKLTTPKEEDKGNF